MIWNLRRSQSKSAPHRVHKFSAASRMLESSDMAEVESKPPLTDNVVTAGSSEQGQEKSSILYSSPNSVSVVPSAQSSTQVHATIEGLRERSGRQK